MMFRLIKKHHAGERRPAFYLPIRQVDQAQFVEVCWAPLAPFYLLWLVVGNLASIFWMDMVYGLQHASEAIPATKRAELHGSGHPYVMAYEGWFQMHRKYPDIAQYALMVQEVHKQLQRDAKRYDKKPGRPVPVMAGAATAKNGHAVPLREDHGV